MPGTRKLGKPTDQRMAMIRAMVTFLLEKGQIKTTVSRAKEVRSMTEKMITLGKQNDLSAYRKAMSFMTKEDVVHELFTIIAPKFAERNGGYTRVLKLGPRRGDSAEMAIVQLLETKTPIIEEKKGKKAEKEKKPVKTEKAVKTAATTKKADKAEKVDEADKPAKKVAKTTKAKEDKSIAKKETTKKATKTETKTEE